ncbi:exosome complex component RRP41-like [Uloborus diversus]|uniref:exosome complex component RRP41-like n=1 Tax=Uloborus diversus TaxID=327109 RepID=UPI00240A4AFB|nr:exosome complex component RRP41-like [Uloborus diversus]
MNDYKLLSSQGFRIDGRRPHELREIKCKLGISAGADGSAFVEQGNTKVLVSVHGPHDITSFKSRLLHDRAYINCEFRSAPFSGYKRKKSSLFDKMNKQMEVVLKQAFETTILSWLYPRSQIDIFFLPLSTDGGICSACINAGTLALIDAGISLKDFLCACSSGIINDEPLVDINHFEKTLGGAELNLAVLQKSGAIVCDELATERLHRDHIAKIRYKALEGCKQTYEILDAVVRKHYIQSNIS